MNVKGVVKLINIYFSLHQKHYLVGGNFNMEYIFRNIQVGGSINTDPFFLKIVSEINAIKN